jgi:hypothetical protein
MPPRFAYWTILAGGLPTAFRTVTREELLPVLNQLKRKHPDAVMRWFARGELWDSPETAQAAKDEAARQRDAGGSDRPDRGKTWRPGGEHLDPRQRFKDAKKAENQQRRRERWERKEGKRETRETGVQPDRRPDAQPRPEGGRHDGSTEKPWTGGRERSDRTGGRSGDRPAWRPKPDGARPTNRPAWRPKPDGVRPTERPTWKAGGHPGARGPRGKPNDHWGGKPGGSYGERPRPPRGRK